MKTGWAAGAAPGQRDLAWIVLCYALVFGTLLVATGFLPYVFDNNESFSAFVHAQNLYRFDLGQSFGLTDEAYGPNPAAHPYVYTHQGNFPRLFAFLMYAVGLRSVEAQIAVSTFTIGLGSVLLAWTFFSRLAGRAMANIAALLLMTEYILSAQWLVNSFKVWHGFLLFAVLVLIQNYAKEPRARWLGLLVLASFCVGYFDLLMAIFTFTSCAAFALWILRHERKPQLRALAALIVGGALSVALLVGQLLAYYGLDGLRQDLALTFVGRNFAGMGADKGWEDFFTDHHIVFWEALHDSRSYSDIGSMLRAIFRYGFGVLTPYFTFLVFAVLLPPVVASGIRRIAARTAAPQALAGLNALAAMFFFVFAANVLLLSICFTDLLESRVNSMAGAFALAGGGIGGLVVYSLVLAIPLTWLLRGSGWRMPPLQRLTAAAVSLLLLATLVLGHNVLYQHVADPMPVVWMYTLGAWTDSGATKLFATLTVAVSIWAWFFSAEETTESTSGMKSLVPFLISLFIGYAVAYALLPGYMVGLNLGRYMPVLVFFVVPVTAAMFRLLWDWAMNTRHWEARLIVGPVAVLVLIHATVFWLGRQSTYIALMPPDTAKGFATIGKEPYKNNGFVVAVYGAPAAAMTGSWAYIDNQFIDTGAYRLAADGYRLDGSDIYKWLADRDSQAYRTPRYAMCVALPTFDNAAHVIVAMSQNRGFMDSPRDAYNPRPLAANSPPLVLPPIGCETAFLAGGAFIDRNPAEPRVTRMLRDPSILHRWSIVELESDFPPFLKPLAEGQRIDIRLKRAGADCVAEVRYEYSQQQGKPEAGTMMRASLEQGNAAASEIYSGPARSLLRLPARGTLSVAITPKTETRVGRTFNSEPLRYSDCRPAT